MLRVSAVKVRLNSRFWQLERQPIPLAGARPTSDAMGINCCQLPPGGRRNRSRQALLCDDAFPSVSIRLAGSRHTSSPSSTGHHDATGMINHDILKVDLGHESSQSLFPPRLKRQEKNENAGHDKKGATRIYRRRCLEIGEHGNDGLSKSVSPHREMEGRVAFKLTAMMPNIRLHVAARALPVPRWGVGKISGVYP